MKIALDVDGILSDFYLGMCRKYNKPYEFLENWETGWIGEVFNEIEDDKGFWLSLPQITPPEGITFDFECYMTSLPDGMKEVREFWLKINGYPDKPVIVSHDKKKTCLEMGIEMLIDDKPETIESLKNSSIIAVRFTPLYLPYVEAYYYHTIKCLDEVNKIIEIYEKT